MTARLRNPSATTRQPRSMGLRNPPVPALTGDIRARDTANRMSGR
jgi:hypothetical protein